MQKTYVSLVLDESGSMYNLRSGAIKSINDAVGTAKETSVGQEVSMSLTTFAYHPKRVFFNTDVNAVKQFSGSDYCPSGQTALFDAVLQAINDLKGVKDVNSEDVSFLVLVTTDGYENHSRASANDVIRLLNEVEKTGRWTFAFQVPPGHKANLVNNFKISSDNVREWESTDVGMAESSVANQVGLTSYFAARSAGVKAVKKFYEVTTDLSNIRTVDLKKLKDIQRDFKTFTVSKEAPVKDFVEDKTKSSYVIGSAYYQLMKPEKVQQKKEVLIMEKGKKAIYGGTEARDLVGLPKDGEAKVEPGNHSNYDIFVQSTSVNRKLPRGTKVLVNVKQTVGLQPTWDHTAVAVKDGTA